MIKEWYEWLDSEPGPGPVLLDGGLGFMLRERGNNLKKGRLWSGRLLRTNPRELKDVANEWLESGADIISTATYQVTIDLLRNDLNLSVDEAKKALSTSWDVLDSARREFWEQLSEQQQQNRRYPAIAISCGPYSAILPDINEYSGKYPWIPIEDIRQFHLSRMQNLKALITESPADSAARNIICFETIGNTSEAQIIVQIMEEEEFCQIPYWISFQCRNAFRISCGDHLSQAVKSTLAQCAKTNLVALGINCFDVFNLPRLQRILEQTITNHMSSLGEGQWRVDTVCYPNSGEMWSNGKWYWRRNKHLSYSEWAELACSTGSKIVGGCCRVGPDYIRALQEERVRLSNKLKS